MRKLLGALIILGLGLIFLNCERKLKDSTGPPLNLTPPPTPKNILLEVGDKTVELSWSVDSLGGIAYFKIYRSDSTGVDPKLYDSTASATTTYTDLGLKNGREYFYQISSVATDKLEGYKSVKVSAVPNLFALTINSGAKYTNNRSVTIGLTGASNTRHVIISEDSLFGDASWQTFSGSKNFTLSFGEGTKYVYVKFRDQDGNESSDLYWDDIILDTQASISSVTENTAGQSKQAGQIIHFTVSAAETEGTAKLDLGTVRDIVLFDDGTQGDAFANDGIYELDYVIPTDVEMQDAVVTGKFTDAAGNPAPSKTATGRVTIVKTPEPVNLFTPYAVPNSYSSITLNWSASNETDFSAYRLYRSRLAGVDSSDSLIANVANKSTTTYTDTALSETTWYHYRVFVFDANNLSAGSNEDSARTNQNTPPTAVVLATPSKVDSTSLKLVWTQNSDFDFDSYRIYRSASLGVDTLDILITVINQAGTTTYTDENLTTGQTYFYRVFVFDRQGLFTGSNEVYAAP
jgi:hypothetical protein